MRNRHSDLPAGAGKPAFSRRIGHGIALVACCVSLMMGAPALAQDGSPVPGDEQSVDTEPTPDVAPPVVEEPTETPTLEPVPTEEPTTAPEPTATPEPVSTLSYLLDAQPTCELAPDQSNVVKSGGAVDYRCTDSVALGGEHVTPATLALNWTVTATIDAGWTVQLLPPAHENEVVDWSARDSNRATFQFSPRAPAGDGGEPAAIDVNAQIVFGLRLTRPACNLAPPVLKLSHAVDLQSPDATAASQRQDTPEPLRIEPELAPIPEPSVTFAGPLDFGKVSVTALGADTTTKTGQLELSVTDLDQACGDWLLHLASAPLTDAAGDLLDGSHLVVISINGDALADGGCDLSAGCDLATLTASPEATATASFTLDIELRMPAQPGTGSFQPSLTAALTPTTR